MYHASFNFFQNIMYSLTERLKLTRGTPGMRVLDFLTLAGNTFF